MAFYERNRSLDRRVVHEFKQEQHDVKQEEQKVKLEEQDEQDSPRSSDLVLHYLHSPPLLQAR